jgi:ABC-type sugar transport system permease subunit
VCLSRTIQTFLLVPGSTVVVVVFGGIWVWIVIDQFGVISTLQIQTLKGVWLVAEGTG